MTRDARPEVTSVKLRQSDIARLPYGQNVAERVRLAIAIASERRDLWPRSTSMRARKTDPADALDGSEKRAIATLDALETATRVVRIEGFLVVLGDAFARFLKDWCRSQSVAGSGASEDDFDAGDGDADARMDALLRELFDPFDVQLQTLAQEIATPGSAAERYGAIASSGPHTPPARAAE
jgi:hypothetical protein